MRTALRKLNLTAHVTSSVGWLGAVAAFLVLSVAGLASQNADIVRSAYVAMNLIGLFVIVPLSLASMTTGVVQSLATHWGLFRHYWVAVKFVLTVGATILLLLHQFTAVASASQRVSETPLGALPEVGKLGPQLVGDAALAVVTLIVTTTLSVYKPWGRTSYGRRAQEQGYPGDTTHDALSLRSRLVLAVIGLIVTAFVLLHLAGGGLHHGR